MASGGSDRDAEYALSKLLQIGTVAEYESEFVVLANRVTGISESLLTSFYISGLKLTLQIDLLRARPTTLGEAFALARITEACFEDDKATTVIAKPNDLNIAVQVQDIEETTLHTSDKVEVVSTSMVATSEEHGYQDGFCMVATYEEHGCQDGLKHVTTRSPAGKKGDLGVITSKGGPPDHMRASEKELDVLKSLLKQKSMFRRQERMLRRQEQQRLAKDAKIQRRIWDPGIKRDDPERWIFSITEYFSLLNTPTDQRLRIRELLASKPLTLGYVFLLARMIEARLEDNRSTATIAKPNDMVHAQHLEETTFHKSNKVKETEARVENSKDSLHDLQEVKTKRALKIDDEKFKKAKSEKVYDAWLPPWLASCLVVYQPYVKNHWKEFMFIQGRIWDPEIKIYFRHHLEDKVAFKEWGMTCLGPSTRLIYLLGFYFVL
ncbi:hypothetical protein Tco_0770533 [Tanacetum coccineum]|uniref:Retrotransposon gag domain-containing protein n=1 Tax=Tanacetum coccineum TaxID=301880 RepID=A0ABQ4ZG10_9ASTR